MAEGDHLARSLRPRQRVMMALKTSLGVGVVVHLRPAVPRQFPLASLSSETGCPLRLPPLESLSPPTYGECLAV